MQQVELTYAKPKPVRFYRRKWVRRALIVVALAWLGWTGFPRCQLILNRYRCWKLDQQAMQYPIGPQQASISYVAPAAPVATVSPSVIAFHNSLLAARSAANLGTLTSPMLSATPVFCHVLTTSQGTPRIAQIYANIVPGTGGGSTSLQFLAITSPIRDSRWVIFGPRDPGNIATIIPDFATATFKFGVVHTLTFTGGTLDTADPSVAVLQYTLDQQPGVIRIHLVENVDNSPFPRMAIETIPDPIKWPGASGINWMGFYQWPIAPPPQHN
jgi:hypothetical protein